MLNLQYPQVLALLLPHSILKTFFCLFSTAGYPAAQSTTHSYSQSAQGYGASGYDSTPAAAAPAASQSYGSQPGYTAQSAYPGYGQQAAPTAPQRYVPLD